MASFGLKVIRGLFGAAEHVAPDLAGRAAFNLFCRTPGRRSLTVGERRAIAKAGSFMQEARHHHLRTRSGWVLVHEFRPVRKAIGAVLVIHGWRSRTEYMRSLIEGFRGAGFRVISLDLPGHGHSAGRRLNMVTAIDATQTAGEWFGPFTAVVGHSFGGAVAVNAAVGSVPAIAPLAADRLVLIASPNSMSDVFEGFGRFVNLGRRTYSAMAGQVQRISGQTLSKFTGSRLLANLPIPTLVVHAADDREVPADDARALASAGDHVRLHWADGLGHRRILSDRKVVELSVGFVTERREPALVH